MKLIVGLGNPDEKYQNTRHNVGFMALDAYAKAKGYVFKTQKSFIGETYLGRGFILLKPLTYMNLSGNSVSLVSSYYHIEPENIMVISDDFNMTFTKLRYREKGSAGGHNGLKSIISSLKTEDFQRLRIGLGDPGDNSINFVLNKFSKDEQDKLNEVFVKTNNVIDAFIDSKPLQEIQNLASNE